MCAHICFALVRKMWPSFAREKNCFVPSPISIRTRDFWQHLHFICQKVYWFSFVFPSFFWARFVSEKLNCNYELAILNFIAKTSLSSSQNQNNEEAAISSVCLDRILTPKKFNVTPTDYCDFNTEPSVLLTVLAFLYGKWYFLSGLCFLFNATRLFEVNLLKLWSFFLPTG